MKLFILLYKNKIIFIIIYKKKDQTKNVFKNTNFKYIVIIKKNKKKLKIIV